MASAGGPGKYPFVICPFNKVYRMAFFCFSFDPIVSYHLLQKQKNVWAEENVIVSKNFLKYRYNPGTL